MSSVAPLVGGDDEDRGAQRAHRSARGGAWCRRGRPGRAGRPARASAPPARARPRSARGRGSGRRAARGSRAGVRATPARRATAAGSTPAAAIASARRTPSSSRRSSTRGIEDAGQRPAAEGRRVETRALLVGEGDDRHRRVLGHGERRAHAQCPVVAPARRTLSRCDPTPTTAPARRAPPSGCRPGRPRRAARPPRPGARTTRRRPRPRASRPAAWCRRSSRPIGLEVGQAPSEIVGARSRATLHAGSGRTQATSPPRTTTATGLRPKR